MKVSDDDYDPMKHNYYRKVLDLSLALPKGSAFEAIVVHDDDCAFYYGKEKYCNCDAVILFQERTEPQ